MALTHIKLRSFPVYFNAATVIYLLAFVSCVVISLFFPRLLGYSEDTWAGYYITIGKLLSIWGAFFGAVIGIVAFYVVLRGLRTAGGESSLLLRMNRLELVLLLIFLYNLISFVVGLLAGSPLNYLVGDTFKGALIPFLYFITKRNFISPGRVWSFMILLLVGETCIMAVPGLITINFAGRTFLYTLFFTLFYEENKRGRKLLFLAGTVYALYIVVATAAFRGTIIIFFVIVAANILLSIREANILRPFSWLVVGVALFAVGTGFFGLELEKNIEKVSGRFTSTLSGKREQFGFEESVFQRIGETLNVIESLKRAGVVGEMVGLGNGAVLNNTWITPSERAIYKTQFKHNIYITLISTLFRQGVIGVILYLLLYWYILKRVFLFRKNLPYVIPRREYVYLKLLLLYHVSVILYGFVAYVYIGNSTVALTLSVLSYYNAQMEREASENRGRERLQLAPGTTT